MTEKRTPEYQRCIDMLSIVLVAAEQQEELGERLNRLAAMLLAEHKQLSEQSEKTEKKSHLTLVK